MWLFFCSTNASINTFCATNGLTRALSVHFSSVVKTRLTETSYSSGCHDGKRTNFSVNRASCYRGRAQCTTHTQRSHPFPPTVLSNRPAFLSTLSAMTSACFSGSFFRSHGERTAVGLYTFSLISWDAVGAGRKPRKNKRT